MGGSSTSYVHDFSDLYGTACWGCEGGKRHAAPAPMRSIQHITTAKFFLQSRMYHAAVIVLQASCSSTTAATAKLNSPHTSASCHSCCRTNSLNFNLIALASSDA